MTKSTKKKRNAYKQILINASPSRSLVIIDQEPIRKKHILNCKRAIKDLNKARGELFEYESVDLPKYNKWYNYTFETDLNKVREAHDKAGEAYQLIKDIEFIKNKLFISHYEAYKIALDKKKNPLKYEALFEEDEKEEEHWSENRSYQEEDLNEDDIMFLFEDFLRKNPDVLNIIKDKKSYQIIFEKFKSQFNSKKNYIPKYENPNKLSEDMNLIQRVKTLYRNLARRLHPDYRKETGEHYENLWFEVQEAYKSNNLEKMEILHSQFNAYEGNFGAEFSIFQIMSAKDGYRSQLKSIRTRIKLAKKDLAWGFSKFGKKDTQFIQEKIKKKLSKELSEHKQNLTYFNEILREWSIPPSKYSSKKKNILYGLGEDDFISHIF